MFSIYKKELQSFFYTPFAYALTALFMLLFTYMFNTSIGNERVFVFETTHISNFGNKSSG